MTKIFRLTYPAPMWVKVPSRESCTYLYRIMKCLGYLPPEKGASRYFYMLWACLVFSISGVYLPIAFVVSLITDFEHITPAEFLSTMQILINTSGAASKTLIGLLFLTNLERTKLLLDKMDQTLRGDNDRHRVNNVVAFCNTIVVFYEGLYWSYSLAMLLTGIISGKPPWMLYNPFFSWRQGVEYVWKQTILEFIISGFCVSFEVVWDAYALVFVVIIRAHIDNLKDHLMDLRADLLKTESENYDDLIGCIREHKLILQCCDLLHPVISRTIFTQFILIGMVLGVTLVNVLLFSGIVRGFASIIFFIAVLFETFPFCYLCDLLDEDCKELSNLLAQSNWIDAEPKYKSTLRIFLLRMQKPIQFTAGGFFVITMNTNLKVAKFAFSVITIVLKMNLAERLK